MNSITRPKHAKIAGEHDQRVKRRGETHPTFYCIKHKRQEQTGTHEAVVK